MAEENRSNKLAGMAFNEALEQLGAARPAEALGYDHASMREGAIEALIDRFENAAHDDENGVKFWLARDLQQLFEYAKWDNFLEVIGKAKNSCRSVGQPIEDHFADVSKMVSLGSGSERSIDDLRLTRYACYLTAQNGDARKKPVAFAQTYFAIQTRRQELQDDAMGYAPLPEDEKRLMLRDEIKEHNKRLASAAKGCGVVDPFDFSVFQTFGYKGLYGGRDVAAIRRAKGLKSHHPILDHMGSTELAANLFRATQTEEKLRRENIKGKNAANNAHYEVGAKVRKAIADIGGAMPEHLPAAEDIVKVGKRLRKAIASTKNRDRKA